MENYTCPTCGDNSGIMELRGVTVHNPVPYDDNPENFTLLWCPCGVVWAPERSFVEGGETVHCKRAIWHQLR